MNIYQIAERAGVSTATVSRYVNKSGYVGKKTAEKIEAVVSEVGYTPSAAAKTLSMGGSFRLVGVVCWNIDDLYYAKAVSVLEKRLKAFGYDIILSCTGESADEKDKSIKMLLLKSVDAIIFIGSVFLDDSGQLLRRTAKSVPCFIINALMSGENIFCAYCDDRAAVKDATQKLIAAGSKNPLFLYDVENYGSEKKRLGFLDACGGQVVKVPPLFADVEEAFGRIYAQHVPDGVVCSNDVIAAAVLRSAKKANISVPQELKIIGHNDSLICLCASPTITSIDNGVEKLSRLTADNILKLFHGEPFPRAIEIDYRLSERESFTF